MLNTHLLIINQFLLKYTNSPNKPNRSEEDQGENIQKENKQNVTTREEGCQNKSTILGRIFYFEWWSSFSRSDCDCQLADAGGHLRDHWRDGRISFFHLDAVCPLHLQVPLPSRVMAYYYHHHHPERRFLSNYFRQHGKDEWILIHVQQTRHAVVLLAVGANRISHIYYTVYISTSEALDMSIMSPVSVCLYLFHS